MNEFAKNTGVQLTFDLNFQPLTDRLSDVQKVKSKHVSAICALNYPRRQANKTYYVPQGPNLLAGHFANLTGMLRSNRW